MDVVDDVCTVEVFGEENDCVDTDTDFQGEAGEPAFKQNGQELTDASDCKTDCAAEASKLLMLQESFFFSSTRTLETGVGEQEPGLVAVSNSSEDLTYTLGEQHLPSPAFSNPPRAETCENPT